jgi:archaemetzincin
MRYAGVWWIAVVALGCDGTAAEPSVRPTTTAEIDRSVEAHRPSPTERPTPEGPRVRARVKLIVLGDFPEALQAAVTRELETELQVAVERIDGVPLPESAYYAPRRRYRADRLLDFLDAHLEGEPPTTRVLGLTSVDISTSKPPHEDWGVFGLGALGGRSCVISTFRLRRRARDEDHLTFRVSTTAVHEVGHTLGLEHCVEARCIMRDAEGSIATVDTSDGRIHEECRAELDRESPQVLELPP